MFFLLLIAVGFVCLAVINHLPILLAAISPAKPHCEQPVTPPVIVQSAGNFTDRINAFNVFLSSLRAEELKRRENDSNWRTPASRNLKAVWGAKDDFLQELSYYCTVVTVILPWITNSSLPDNSNLLIQTYYQWTADETLCSWIKTPGITRKRYHAVYNRKCDVNISDTVRQVSLQPLFLNGKPFLSTTYWPNDGNSYPAHFYTDMPPYAFYMHIHRDAIITDVGHVITDGLKLVLYVCDYAVEISYPSHLEKIPLYDEVFVVNQILGKQVYHRMVEIVPRLSLFVDFLKANPEIRIAAPEIDGRLAELLEVIGLNKSRLVTGVTRAKIAYQPRVSTCGFPNAQESQMLSQLYRDYIRRTFPHQPRNRLILIRRSNTTRKFKEQEEIEKVVKRAASDYNLTYTLFIDNPAPSLNDTMLMFHSAVIIVAPHGAGESNMLFSQPGTYIIEGVCEPPQWVVLWFLRLAHILGHHWHGIASRGGCPDVLDVPASDIYDALIKHLRIWSSSRAGKRLRKKPRFFRFFKNPKNPQKSTI